jgi:hypothetical protein
MLKKACKNTRKLCYICSLPLFYLYNGKFHRFSKKIQAGYL